MAFTKDALNIFEQYEFIRKDCLKKFNQLKKCQRVLVSQEIVIKELRNFISENLQKLLKYIDDNQEDVY